jgi:beta-carotene ketolase (CrtO type)
MTASQSDYDVVVIGAGHNGLACGAYLAKAGRRVLILEERSIVGGFATTEETVAAAPGFKFNPAAMDMATGNIPPCVVDDLDLARHGLRWLSPDPFYSFIDPDGSSIAFWRDYRRTCVEISAFSARDAENYAALTEILRDFWVVISPYMMDHPRRPSMTTIWKVLTRAISRRKHLSRALRVLMSAPGPVLDEWFESPQLRTALACFAIGGVVPLDEPMAGLIMSVMALQHQWGVRRPVGGIGQFTQALAQDVIARGGDIRTSSPVTALIASQGRVIGVATDTGEEIHARRVIGAIDPTTLFLKLAPSDLVPAQVRTELRALGVYRNNFASFRSDVALRETPRLIVAPQRCRELLPSSMMFAQSIDAVRRTSNAIFGGEIAMPRIPVWVSAPSAIDRTLVPPASPGEGLYVFVPAVPFRLRDGMRWNEVRDVVLKDTLDTFEQFAPGVTASIIGCAARSPDDLRAYSNVYQGHLFHADMSAAQMGPWRPTPSLSGYRSPVAGLWHTAAGAHPMGTICAWPGRTAAHTLLREMR